MIYWVKFRGWSQKIQQFLVFTILKAKAKGRELNKTRFSDLAFLLLLLPKILCIASLRKLFLAAAGAKQDGQKSGFILFAFLRRLVGQKHESRAILPSIT
ncbi:MAG: hypothetical protein ACJAXE_002241 [Neolewinella sp.]|jgi:hypothetical protein